MGVRLIRAERSGHIFNWKDMSNRNGCSDCRIKFHGDVREIN